MNRALRLKSPLAYLKHPARELEWEKLVSIIIDKDQLTLEQNKVKHDSVLYLKGHTTVTFGYYILNKHNQVEFFFIPKFNKISVLEQIDKAFNNRWNFNPTVLTISELLEVLNNVNLQLAHTLNITGRV
jgi:hypothetical protein